MRVLVTGSAGFAGKHLCRSLVQHGHQVREFDLRYGRDDVRDYERVYAVIGLHEPDLIFHLAAVAWPRESLTDPRRTLDVNITGTLNILEAVRHSGSHARILLAGTSEEYGYAGRDGEELTEESACHPDTPYGVSKLAAGALGMTYARRHGLPVVVTRAFNHTGQGRQPCNAESAFARRIVAAERGHADAVWHGDLSSSRNFTSVHDVVRAYQLVIDAEPGIYNICSGCTVTMQQVMDTLGVMARKPVALKYDPGLGAPAETSFPVPSWQKIRQACGWEPQVSLEGMLAEVMEYWRSR